MLINVKVFPGSKEEMIVRKIENSFEVKTKAKPIMGAANRSVVKILSSYFNTSTANIKLVKGFKGRNKVFAILK